MVPKNLLGITRNLDELIFDLAFLGQHFGTFHPANAGDVSTVLADDIGSALLRAFEPSVSEWFHVRDLPTLAALRNDGRSGYRTQGIRDAYALEWLKHLKDQFILITRTGAQIPALQHTIDRAEDGRLLMVLQMDATGCRFRIVFGNNQYGSLPSIEAHVHMLGNAINLAEGRLTSAVVHAHPANLILLGRHPNINGDFSRFNAAIFTQTEGILRNCPDLVGIVPYYESGSEALAVSTLRPLTHHRAVLWMHHGFTVRESSIRQAYMLMAYAEDAASATLASFVTGAVGLPFETVSEFLSTNGLVQEFRALFGPQIGAGELSAKRRAS
jgi:hypothetical protein